MTVCNMSIEAGARAGMIAPDDTTFAYLEGRPARRRARDWERALERWRALRTDDGATFDDAVDGRRRRAGAAGHLGHEPGHGRAGRRRRARSRRLRRRRRARGGRARARATWASTPGTPLVEVAHRPGLHRLVHERAHRGSARGGGGRRRPPRRRRRAGDGRPRLGAGEAPGRGGGAATQVFESRRLRVAAGRLLDVPRHEPGHPRRRRALRLDLEPQLRGPPGRGRRARTCSAPRWPPRPRSPATSPTCGSSAVKRAAARYGHASRCSTAPTSTPTRSSRSSS